MKILALEIELKKADTTDNKKILRDEALAVTELNPEL